MGCAVHPLSALLHDRVWRSMLFDGNKWKRDCPTLFSHPLVLFMVFIETRSLQGGTQKGNATVTRSRPISSQERSSAGEKRPRLSQPYGNGWYRHYSGWLKSWVMRASKPALVVRRDDPARAPFFHSNPSVDHHPSTDQLHPFARVMVSNGTLESSQAIETLMQVHPTIFSI